MKAIRNILFAVGLSIIGIGMFAAHKDDLSLQTQKDPFIAFEEGYVLSGSDANAKLFEYKTRGREIMFHAFLSFLVIILMFQRSWSRLAKAVSPENSWLWIVLLLPCATAIVSIFFAINVIAIIFSPLWMNVLIVLVLLIPLAVFEIHLHGKETGKEN